VFYRIKKVFLNSSAYGRKFVLETGLECPELKDTPSRIEVTDRGVYVYTEEKLYFYPLSQVLSIESEFTNQA
jgi:hypothetical protein